MAKTLGPFEVSEFLASGGMADVYVARHRAEGHAAAIKLVRHGLGPGTTEALLLEVRAVAAMSHPSIVAVYDYGKVTETESRASDGEFRTDSLWFAMEHATLGSLDLLGESRSWAVVRRILTEMLDALAHAHARGLVHRDLKPGNVLLTQRDQTISLLLADFGIAHVTDPDRLLPERTNDISAPGAGTPRYMAPEQFRGAWRDLGPWTDLYALGCLGWELTTGAPPFAGVASVEVAIGHLTRPLGEYVPLFDVPPGLEGWLRRLLEKPWQARFLRAADAAWHLASLDRTHSMPLRDVDISGEIEQLLAKKPHLPTLGAPELETARVPSIHMRALQASDGAKVEAHVDAEHPATPPDWRPVKGPKAKARTGLGLFGLREPDAVGRESERDMLWAMLRRVTASGQAEAIVLDGGEGSGKSTLTRWLGVRAHELGVATVLRASHAATISPATGLPNMLARHLACGGLGRRATFERIWDAIEARTPGPETTARAALLTEIVAPGLVEAEAQVPAVEFSSPRERYACIESFLRGEAQSRPLLLLFDDVQWGADALAFARYLMESTQRSASPIMLVAGVSAAELREQPLASRRLRTLIELPSVHRHALAPLDDGEHLALLREMVGLRHDVARDLVKAAHGDTNYSLCVLHDWVSRGILTPSADGYRFVDGADLTMPTDVIEAWEARLDRFTARFAIPARVREALEIGAALGREVDTSEWEDVCARRGVDIPSGLLDALIDGGLLRWTDTGFALAHSAMQTALARRADAAGRWRAIHADCAAAIVRSAPGGASASERAGQHYLLARDVDHALAALAQAIDKRLATSAYDEAADLCDRYLAAAFTQQSDASLVIRARRAEAMRYLSRPDIAEQEAREILEIGRALNSDRGRAEGLRVLGGLEHGRGNALAGIETYTQAVATYQRLGDTHGMSKCVHGRGWLRIRIGQFSEAMADFTLGADLADGLGEQVEAAWSRQGLAETAVYLGDLATAERAANAALRIFRERGSRSGEGMALTSLANAYREQAKVDEARLLYGTAIDLLASFDSHLVAFPRLHDIMLEVRHGDRASTRAALLRAGRSAAPVPFRAVAGIAATWVAAAGTEFDEALADLRSLAQEPEHVVHPLVQGVWLEIRPRLGADESERVRQVIAPLLSLLAA